MRKATDKEINDFIKYRANHVALVQRIGRVVFGKDFSTHDSDKIEADGEKLNQYALRNAMIEGTYHPHGEDKEILCKLAGHHVKSQKHHPEYWDDSIDPETFDDSNPPQVLASKMPDRYILEMCCDWAAVALKKNQPLFKWINKNCFDDTRFIFTPRQQELIVEYTKEIMNSIEDEHLEYPGVKYTAKQVEPAISKMTEDDCGTSMSGDLQAMAPENPVKIGNGTGIIDPSGKLPLNESILDVPMKDTYEGVLKDGKMVAECRSQILKTIKAWKKQINFDFNIYKVWAKGSLLTKRYNDTTDLDVGIYTDMTSNQLDEVIAILPKGQNIIVNGEESTHPLDFYIQVKGDSTDMSNFDAVYDVFNDEWVKEPEDYENEIPLDYVMEVSNFFINGCSIAIRNYENDKILYEYYNALDPNIQEITEDEKAQHLSKKKEDLKADLDALRVALRMISSFRTEAYTDGGMDLQINITSDNPHVTIQEQLAKVLEKFGIRQKLRDYVAECSKLLGVERSLTESLENDELDGTMVAVAFGRYNPPTYGHLLLWKKVASITADANLIYASHSQDRKKNPLSYETKGALIKGILKEQGVDAEFVNSDAKTLIDVAVELSGKYDNFVFVAGSDRIEEMVDLLKKYNGVDTPKGKYEYKTIAGLNAGQRDPDADDVTGVSGTKAREIAMSGDLEKFSKIIPISDEWILKDIMEEIQRNLKK